MFTLRLIIEAILTISILVMVAIFVVSIIPMDRKGDSMQIFSNKIFDILKWISIVALPALSTFIVVLGKIWNWGDIAPMVAQTITAVAVLLGALLGISTIQYNKGESE